MIFNWEMLLQELFTEVWSWQGAKQNYETMNRGQWEVCV